MVEQNTRKLSKTLFLMTGASAAFWVPSLVLFSCLNFAPGMFPKFVKYLLIIIHICNSVVNPVIYSLRMPMFRQSLRRFRLRMQRKKFIVHWGYFYRAYDKRNIQCSDQSFLIWARLLKNEIWDPGSGRTFHEPNLSYPNPIHWTKYMTSWASE